MNSFLSPFSLFPPLRSSVYVISDSDFASYKQKQLKAEIAELEALIDGHQSSIERLKVNIDNLKKDLPKLESSKEDVTTFS